MSLLSILLIVGLAICWVIYSLTVKKPLRFLGQVVGWGVAFMVPFGLGWLIRAFIIEVGLPEVPYVEYSLGLGLATAVVYLILNAVVERDEEGLPVEESLYTATYLPLAAGAGLIIAPLGFFIASGLLLILNIVVIVSFARQRRLRQP